MVTSITRRSAVSILGAGLGLGAIVGSSGLSACGGGGATDGAAPPSGGGNGGGGTSGLAGSFWYDQLDKLYVCAGGTQEPTPVNQYLGQGEIASHFAVERTGPRYLQRSHFSGATASDWTAVLNVYEHASNQAYCFVNLAGYVAAAAVSPSGKYVAAFRSPQLSDSTFQEGSTHTIVDLIIIDISDVNNIRDIRSTRTEGRSAVYGFQWLADDRFVYMTWGDGNFGDSMFSGSVATGTQGDRLLGPVDKQGLRVRSFSVHPDESSMLVSMFSDDGVALGVWDVYLYQLNGQRIDRITAFDQGYSGAWSPDGRHIFFKAGSESRINCNPALGCPETCSSHYVSSGARSIRLADAQTLELGKVPCYSNIMWRA
jgi:hypothetical protein